MKMKLENINHQFGQEKVLTNVSIEIDNGEFFTLLGPSGCGKTTLLRIIAGLLNPTEGRIYLEDKEITDLSPDKRNIGMVFQNYALFPHLNVEENVAYGLKLKGLTANEISKRVFMYLDMVDMTQYHKRMVSELSGGQQQRVALARTLAVEPKLLLLDEPLSNLDATLRERTRDEIKDLQKKLGITTIFITHDQKEALSVSDRIAVMEKGQIIQIGSPWDVYKNPTNDFVAGFIGESNKLSEELMHALSIPETQSPFIRPESLKIVSQKPDFNSIEGVVRKVAFNGSTVDYDIEARGTMLRVRTLTPFEGTENIALADQVHLYHKGLVE